MSHFATIAWTLILSTAIETGLVFASITSRDIACTKLQGSGNMQGKKSPNNFDDDYEDEYYIDLDESRGDDDDTDEDINDSDYYSAQEYDEGLFIL